MGVLVVVCVVRALQQDVHDFDLALGDAFLRFHALRSDKDVQLLAVLRMRRPACTAVFQSVLVANGDLSVTVLL